MKNPKLIGFANTAKPDAARKFYRDTLGLKLVSEDPFAIVFDVGGTMLRVAKVDEVVIAPYTVLGFAVDDIQSEAKALTKKGVKFQHFQGLQQDEWGVWTSPARAKIAWMKDPDGNVLSLTQFPG